MHCDNTIIFHQEPAKPKPELSSWKVDYSDMDPDFKTNLNMSGIHMLIINDSNRIFYPILQMSIEKIGMSIENTAS